MDKINYWRKSYSVEATRITRENIREIVEAINGKLLGEGETNLQITSGNSWASVGDWYVFIAGLHLFFTHEDFSRKFHTHPEQMANDERYAMVYQLVRYAMVKQDTATYHGESTEGMDLIAIQTTKKILGEL